MERFIYFLILYQILIAASPVGAQPQPNPNLHIDQFGYRTGDMEVAVLANPQTGFNSGQNYVPGTNLEIVDNVSGQTVFTGSPTP